MAASNPLRPTKVRVAVVGLAFGASFVPIYRAHPDVEYVGIVDPDDAALDRAGGQSITRRHHDLEEVLASDDYDAVHIVTPLPLHTQQTLAVLNAGKHCACAVPMAMNLDDLRAIVAAQRRSGKNYMMMETSVYTRQFLYVKELAAAGEFGRIQFLRGAHYQDLEQWPSYWRGLPPMWYATHAVAPCLALTDARATRVHCFGSGVMREELRAQYGNPFPIETAIFQLDKPALAMEITRSLSHTARDYVESFNLYGEKRTFEWAQIEKEEYPVLFTMENLPPPPQRGTPISARRVSPRDRPELLPPEIAWFTAKGKFDDTNPQRAHETRGGHHGSHPHLVHEFIRSIIEGRKPWVDAVRAADWTAPGICAHESAMRGGQCVEVPSFRAGD